MPNWPRTIIPQEATWPRQPTALVAMAQSGKTQIRSTTQVGAVWTEWYGPLRRSDATARAFLATVQNYWRNGTIFQIDHRAQRNLLGTGTGTPVISGASQTGSNIVTSGWTAGVTGILKAGDVVLLPGLTIVYEITADVTSNGSGGATLPINPPIFAGASPTNSGAITRNNVAGNVTYRARIANVNMPKASPNEFYMALSIDFVEVPL